MRPIDLAASAGVSTQQVRNLEAAGALPPADRSASGYRIYREEHLSALHCYQVLVPGHGASSARAIMAAVSGGEAEEALEAIDAGHAALQWQRRALDETASALARVTEDLAESPRPSEPLAIGQLADLLGVRTSALRVWEDAGLLSPTRRTGQRHRLYDAEDIRDARVIHLLRQGHYRFSRIKPVIEELRGSSGSRLPPRRARRAPGSPRGPLPGHAPRRRAPPRAPGQIHGGRPLRRRRLGTSSPGLILACPLHHAMASPTRWPGREAAAIRRGRRAGRWRRGGSRTASRAPSAAGPRRAARSSRRCG
jgi:DNA-binding transcriptional MerR regulator